VANQDLRSFLEKARQAGEVVEIKKPISPRFAMPAVVAKLAEMRRYPAVYFARPEGSKMPVLTNVFASRRRLAMALGCDESSLNAVFREREDRLTRPVLVPSGHIDQQLLGGTSRLSVIYKNVRATCPTVRDVYMPPSGCCRFTCYISIKKRHEGEAKNAMAAALASDPFIKYVVVVDEDVNIFDDGAVLKAMATRLRPEEDAFFIRGAKGHPLDPTAQKGYLVTKVGIDATKPLSGYPETVKVPGTDRVNLEDLGIS